jgi:hypothetical protein
MSVSHLENDLDMSHIGTGCSKVLRPRSGSRRVYASVSGRAGQYEVMKSHTEEAAIWAAL